MNRQELGLLLIEVKNNAHVRLADSLPYIHRLSIKKIEAIEKGAYNYELSDAFLYLNMCGATIEILDDFVNSTRDIRSALIREMRNFEISVPQLSKQSGVPVTVINSFLQGQAQLKIDTFLNIANALGEELTIN